MIVQHRPQLHLTYCLNIHPGETWAENFAAIKEKTVDIKRKVCPHDWFGLGLRLSAQAAAELAQPGNREEALDFFASNQLYPFSINGFPYGQFHSGPVKQNVYAPDWRTTERRDYTLLLADILASMQPDSIEGSISTVPGSFKPWITTDDEKTAMALNMAACVAYLAALRDDTGRTIHLGLEPEPDCFLETTTETISFFKEMLLTTGVAEVARITGATVVQAEEMLRRHLGVCFDTCHAAMQYETLYDSLRSFEKEGIRISKVQLSAAIETGTDPASLEALEPFCEQVYLHQVKGLSGSGAIYSWYDLPDALQEIHSFPDVQDLRVHYHVPLFFPGTSSLSSTARALTPDFFHLVRSGLCPHLEIETYTFDVLPPDIAPTDVTRSIAREYAWVLGQIEGL